ncbi:TPA: SMP-30/gluconolactonase/LRE family protein [Klebsiella pneumoniae]
MNGLNHNALTCSAVPIPPWERSLQTVEAQPYFNVSQASLVLEGIVFDRNNNLLFVDVATGRVFKLTPEQQLSIVLKENSFGASGLAVHKDGRIFIASVGDMQRGSVRAIEPNGTREQMIVAPDTGFLVNDLVVAISGQGRVMVFNRNGLPIGQIVLPDRDKGRNLKSTSLAIRPGHRELFIVANSGTEPGGAMIFRSGAFAPAPFPFSHQ